MAIARHGVVYFLLVFAAGFLFGLVRVPFLEPWLGERWAQLVEMPLMWLVIYWAAGRPAVAGMAGQGSALLVGVLALSLLLLAEVTVVLAVRQMTVMESVLVRDLVAGAVYLVSLVWFALAPWWRLQQRDARQQLGPRQGDTDGQDHAR